MTKRRGRRIAGVALSVFATLLLLDFALVPFALRDPSLALQAGFAPPMQVLAQSSKAELVPRDYVLLLGDSYALGFGDWLDGADHNTNPPYHSAHVLRELTGRDVITFGNGGAGSVPAMVSLPLRRMLGLRRFGLGPPSTVLVYVYEGNDLNNNLRYLRRHWEEADPAEVADDAAFDAFLDREVAAPARRRGWLENWYAPSWAAHVFQDWRDRREKRARAEARARRAPDGDAAAETPRANLIRSGGAVLEMPGRMQSPALELTEDEVGRALQIAERSLFHATGLFEGSDVHVVYLPSPLSCYELAGETVSIRTYEDRDEDQPSVRVGPTSDRIAAGVAALAEAAGVDFFDARPALRAAAAIEPIHGPGDWGHLNRRGYTALAEAIAQHLSERP